MMWHIQVVAAFGRPDPVGHVRWIPRLVTERSNAFGKASARSCLGAADLGL